MITLGLKSTIPVLAPTISGPYQNAVPTILAAVPNYQHSDRSSNGYYASPSKKQIGHKIK